MTVAQVVVLEERGFGFVTFFRKAGALAALDALSGRVVNGKRLIVKRKNRTDGDTSSDFSFGVRFGSHVRSHGSQSSEQIGKHSTFGRGTCFTCGRPGHKMMECPVNFGVSKYESVAGEDFKVCVDNLPPGIMWQEVKDLFEREVGTTSYAMPRMEHGGQGSGIIGFERKVEQELALVKMDGYEFGGRRLQVKSYVCSNRESANGLWKDFIQRDSCLWCEQLGHWCGLNSRGCLPIDWETLQRAVAHVAGCLAAASHDVGTQHHKLGTNMSKPTKREHGCSD